jgi:hypothetical protein
MSGWDDLSFFKRWTETDQDEELRPESSFYIKDDELPPLVDDDDVVTDDDLEFWKSVRWYAYPGNLTLDDKNWIRRILMRTTERGTGYGVRLYHYPDYSSGLSLWVPDAWKINNFETKKLWEQGGCNIWNVKFNEWALCYFRGGFNCGAMPNHTVWYSNKSAKWREVIIQLEYWEANEFTYYFEEFLNFLPWANRLDEAIQTFILKPYPVWKNISFENTTPNIVIERNWKLCKATIDKYFKLGKYSDDYEELPTDYKEWEYLRRDRHEDNPNTAEEQSEIPRKIYDIEGDI